MNFEEIMIDLETLGQGDNAVFPVVCAYKFNSRTGEVGECFYKNIDIHSQIEKGREVDGSTIEWWFKQDQSAREELMKPGDSLDQVLDDLRYFIGENAIVWSNGIDFDLSILAHAYKRKTPWKFWNQRDMRTVLKLSGIETKAIEFEGVKHSAKDDCLHQIKLLHVALVSLGLADE